MDKKQKAAGGHRAASQIALPDESNDSAEVASAQAAKYVAILAYCHGAASLSATAAKFEQHREWRSA